MNILSLAALINGLFSLLIGIFVISKNPRSKKGKLFFLLCAGLFIWGIFYFLWGNEIQEELALIYLKILCSSIVLSSSILYHFILVFLNKEKVKRKTISLFYIITLLIIFLIFSPYYVVGYKILDGFYYWPLAGIGAHLQFLWAIFLVIFSFWTLLSALSTIKKEKKLQIQYLGLAIGFSTIGLLFNTPQWYGIELYPYGNFVMFLYPLIIAFAIVKYHLFEIKVILTEILVGIMGILLLILPFLMPTSGLKLLTTILFLLFCVFGYLLIRYTHQEIKRREELKKLSDQLQVSNIKLEAALEELRKSYDELKQLDEAKTMFLSIASHQLRTPLSAMKGYLSMVLSGEYGIKIEGQIKDFLLNVYQSNERLIHLVNDILDITRLQMGKMQFNFQPTQLEDLVQSVVEELKQQIKQKNISLEFQKPKEALPKVKLDPQKFRQVILNLIDNALKYTEKGKILISLYQKPPNSVLLTVKDTGIGMEKEELDNLFQLFERGADAVKTNAVGVGIGLYASREIVKAHQGKIWAESEGKNKGSTFYVEIPVK